MKKKLILFLTALSLVFATVFSFTACNKTKVNIKKGMTPEKIFKTLANAEIKSFTLTLKGNDGSVVTQRFTDTGVTISETNTNGETSVMTYLYEDGRSYQMSEAGGETNVRIVDMAGAKVVPIGQHYSINFFQSYVLTGISDYIYCKNNGYDTETSVSSEKGKIIIKADLFEVVASDINNTSLIIPDALKDYKSREATDYLFATEDVEGGLAVRGKNPVVNDMVLEAELPESYNGKNIVEIKDVRDIATKKLVIPATVKKIGYFSTYNDTEFYFKGTKAQFVEIDVEYFNSDIVVHCADGDFDFARN